MKHSEIFIKSGDSCDMLVWIFLKGVYGLTSLEAYKTTVMDSSFHLSSVLKCTVFESKVREKSVQIFIAGTSSMPEIEQALNLCWKNESKYSNLPILVLSAHQAIMMLLKTFEMMKCLQNHQRQFQLWAVCDPLYIYCIYF